MPPAQQSAAAGLALAAGVAAVALVLAWRQWREGHRRESDLSTADSAHFQHQDIRRWVGVAIMVLLALGLAVGSQVRPRAAGRTNLWFVQIWLSICVLVLALLILALFDWLGTSRYARRHRRAIALERRQVIEEELRRRSRREDRNGPQDSGNGAARFGPDGA